MPDLSQPNKPNPLHNEDDNLAHLGLITQLEDPWYRTLIQSVKELVSPPELPPLELTSKPVAVVDLETKWYRSFYQNLRDLIRYRSSHRCK